ncbi:hypothetical protein [Myxosarcina sp. GI1(2024)]
MKSFLYASLSTLVLCLSLSTQAKADALQTTPFNLVNLARHGYFQEHNIPSYSRLYSAVRARKIKAEDIVKAAIAKRRLSPETLKDKGYLRTVKFMLNRLYQR